MDPRRASTLSQDLQEESSRDSFVRRVLQWKTPPRATAKAEDVPLQDFSGKKTPTKDRTETPQRQEGSERKTTTAEDENPKQSKRPIAVKDKWFKAAAATKFIHRLQDQVDKLRDEETVDNEGKQEGRKEKGTKAEDSEIKRGFLLGDKNSQGIFPGMDDNPEEDINDIVDRDDHRIEEFVSHHLVGYVVNSIHFRILIFVLIILNSLLIGLQTDEEISVKWRYLFIVFDQVVMAVFIFEILLKWHYGFWIFWKDGWNILDFIIIIGMVLGPEVEFLSSNLNLRILRVFRAFRSLRSIGALAGLSMVATTIICSIPDMANIGMLLGIIILVFGVMGTTLFASILPNRFADLPTAMFSLFICVTQDGWVDIYKEFRDNGTTAHIGGSIYLFFCIMVGAFVFANLVVAVVVTNLERAMKEFAEESRAKNALADQGDKDGEFSSGHHNEKANIVEYRDNICDTVNLSLQTPFELATLRSLTPEKLEKYLMLLTMFEENLVEYEQLRKDLSQVYDVVRTLNAVLEEDVYAEAEEVDRGVKAPFPGLDFVSSKELSLKFAVV